MARDICASKEGRTSRRERKKVEMLFAHLERILKLDRLRLREPNEARDEFHLAASAQNLRKLAKLIPMPQPSPGLIGQGHPLIQPPRSSDQHPIQLDREFFNKIRLCRLFSRHSRLI